MADLPNADEFTKFLDRKDDGPVVMLNLLKFKPDGGAESYAQYAAAVTPLLDRVGGKSFYLGTGAERLIGDVSGDWDMVLLVQYPKRQALLDMTTSEDYQAVQHLRDDALVRSVLLATDPVAAP